MTFIDKYYVLITVVTQFLISGIVYVGTALLAKKLNVSSQKGNVVSAIVCIIMALIGIKIALFAPSALTHHQHWAQGLSATWCLWTMSACLALRMLFDRAARVPIIRSYAIAAIVCAPVILSAFILADR